MRPIRFAIVMLTLFACLSAQAAERPNIIIILADDMGYSDLGSYGSEINTPNLDRLAESGLRFTQFYNDARCCPTRASLLTGVYPHQAGMAQMVSFPDDPRPPGPNQGYLNDKTVTIAELLREAGYRTYISGKWHVGEHPDHWPLQRGFDRYFGLISGASSYYELIADQARKRRMAIDNEPFTPDPDSGFYMTDAFSDWAVRFISEHHRDTPEQPFFLYLSYTAPHWPLHAPEEQVQRYLGRYMIGWDELRRRRFQRQRQMGLIDHRHVLTDRADAGRDIPAWEDVPENERADWDRRMAVHAAMVDIMDQGIGRVIAELERHGALENTLIVFLSDNGSSDEDVARRGLDDGSPIGQRGSYAAYLPPWANASNTPYRYFKRYAHEGGIATPFIAHWPQGITQPGEITRQFGHITDLMATAVELAGADYPQSREGQPIHPLVGKSLVPVFQGETRQGHERYFWEHIGAAAMREGDWKLVRPRARARWELYNLSTDPTETRNLASRLPGRVRDMTEAWQQWYDHVMEQDD